MAMSSCMAEGRDLGFAFALSCTLPCALAPRWLQLPPTAMCFGDLAAELQRELLRLDEVRPCSAMGASNGGAAAESAVSRNRVPRAFRLAGEAGGDAGEAAMEADVEGASTSFGGTRAGTSLQDGLLLATKSCTNCSRNWCKVLCEGRYSAGGLRSGTFPIGAACGF